MEKAIPTAPMNSKGRLPTRSMRKMNVNVATEPLTTPKIPLARSFTD